MRDTLPVVLSGRYRHLMNDLISLIPHSKKDSKLDTKNDRGVINEVADMKVGHGSRAVSRSSSNRI
jgi:hypothetical protein